MARKEFFRGVDHQTRLRVLVVTERGRVSRFMVQLETLIEELWTPIARYDTHHGFAHLDLLHLDGTADKISIVARDFNEALHIAFADLLTNWDRYVKAYLEQ